MNLSSAQANALRLLARAYNEDVAVRSAHRTEWVDNRPTVNRATASSLAALGLVRFSQPLARYVLITPRGQSLPFLYGLSA